MRWHWSVWVAAALVGSVLHLVPVGPLPLLVHFPLSVLGVVAMVVGALRRRPHAAGWWCIAAVHVLWLVADVQLVTQRMTQGPSAPPPLGPLYLVGYLPLAAGLLLMARGTSGRRRRAGLLDGAIVSVALALLGGVLVVGPGLDGGASALPQALVISYLVADVVMITLVVHLLVAAPRRTTSHLLGAAALVVVMVCDAAWTLVGGRPPFGALLAVGVLTSNLLWAAAALQPATPQHEPDRREGTDAGLPAELPAGLPGELAGVLSRRRLTVLGLALLLPSALLGGLALAGQAVGWRPWAVVAAGALMSVLVVLRMTEAMAVVRAALAVRERLSRDLQREAAHDPLTGLANRASSRAHLVRALRAAQHGRGAVGVLFVDLDGFKAVNDTHGHQAGDEVLRTVAGRLTSCVRTDDLAGRLGGDEFVVVLSGVNDVHEVAAVAQRVVGHLAAPVTAAGRLVRIGASVGAVLSPEGAVDPDALLREADTAAYRAKAAGRGRVVLFDDALRRELAERSALEADLRTAIATDQLVLHYQPVVDLRSRAVHGAEALVRWRRPGRGLVPPSEFVPVAETSDLVCELGRWVLRAAARQQVAWARSAADGAGPVVGVNLAPRHLAHPSVVDDVASALAEVGAAPGRLLVEVTETDLVDSAAVVGNLRRLRELGVRVAIDDFGTGWTSIGQLQHLPSDVLKVDRGLVVSTAPGAAELLSLVVSAGHAFAMDVVVEGVETAGQEAAAVAAGADRGQGWRWCAALPPARLDALFAAGGSPQALQQLADALAAAP